VRILFLTSLSLLTFFLLISKEAGRTPSSAGPERLVLGVQQISQESTLVLIGLECSVRTISCDNWQDLGFESMKGQLHSVEPKFLVFKTKNYIEQVYTFEFGTTNRRAISKAMEGEDKEVSHYLKLPKRIQAKLPALLIDVLYAKSRVRSGSRLALEILNLTPLSIFSRTAQELIKHQSAKKFYQASYLSRLIEMAVLDENFPELIEVFGRHNLHDLGASLRLRYRGSESDVITSIGIDETNRAEFYEEFIRLRTEVQSINMSKLANRASEEGLLLIPYSRDMAMLFYDPQVEIDKEKYNDLLLNSKLIENKERYQDVTKGDNKLVPLGTFLLTDSIAPKKIVDFESPHAGLKKEKILNVVDYATDIGLGLFDIGGLGTALKGGMFAGKLILKKKGIIYGSANIESEAHMEALMETGMVKIDSEEVSKDMLAFYLDELDLSQEVEDYYTKILASNDPSEIDRGLREIVLHFQSSQTSKRFNHGMDEAYKLSNKIVSWKSFKKWLNDEQKHTQLDQLLKDRTKRRNSRGLRREPSSVASDAAFVFMVDGLRPDRFKEAFERGVMPHMGEFFIKNGLHFDSYTTRSLTLPSWSSILTGLDQDEHGLKSNGPMSRELGRPMENYIDPRKDLLNYGFNINRESRSYTHLKESMHTWLPDYFEESEVHTNYMPVNNQAFPPVGQIFRAVLKDYQRLLFGSFSATVALDRATAMQTVRRLQKNPGKTKLVLNWFTCVDVFSHNNNKALDKCYKEMDESFRLIMDQLKLDPAMKDAHVYLISDHGHTGGHEGEHSHYKILESGSYFNNTALNLTTLFAGNYHGYRHFNFSPFVFYSPYPDNDLKFLSEFQIQPFRYRYHGGNREMKKPSDVLIDFSGDSLSQIYFKHPATGWGERLSYYELTKLNQRNIIRDLLDVRITNNVNHDSKVRKALSELNNSHPVMFVAHPLHSCSKTDIEEIVGEKIFIQAREPILIESLNHDYGLILTKKEYGKMLYKYFLLDRFTQTEDKRCAGRLSARPKDVLEQFEKIQGRWLGKMELLEILKNEKYPTSLITLVSTLTLSENLSKFEKRQAEVPDLLLHSNIGFNFNSSYSTEADHGGLLKQEAKNSFFYNQVGQKHEESVQKEVYSRPVFNYFLTPFVLENTGRKSPEEKFQDIPSFFEFQGK
jgi:hypothetical protein